MISRYKAKSKLCTISDLLHWDFEDKLIPPKKIV